MKNQISAIFNTQSEAILVIRDLRAIGLEDNRLSIVTKHMDDTIDFDGKSVTGNVAHAEMVNGEQVDGEPVAETTEKGILAGAGLGALVGLGAMLIPGVAPLVIAGAIVSTVTTIGVAALAGAVVGGASGAIAGALTKAGYPENEAAFYAKNLETGGTLVSADIEGSMVTPAQVHAVYTNHMGIMAPILAATV